MLLLGVEQGGNRKARPWASFPRVPPVLPQEKRHSGNPGRLGLREGCTGEAGAPRRSMAYGSRRASWRRWYLTQATGEGGPQKEVCGEQGVQAWR